MTENILIVGTQVAILFVLIAVGFGCSKTKILNDVAVKGIINFMLYIVTPCVIVNSYRRDFDPAMLKGLGITLAASFLSHAADILIVHLIVHDKDKRRENVLRFGSVFSNCGYMSLPLQNALLGADGVFYGATYIAVFNIVMWTYGVFLMDGGVKSISVKKAFINPGIIGTAAGFLVFLLSIRLPQVIAEPIEYISALNTPLPMIVIGYHLASAKFNIKGAATYVSMLFRLIISPLIMLTGLYLCGIHGTILVACVIAASAPCAAATTMFAEKFGGDTTLSAACVSITTIISIITMPVIVAVAAML